MIRSFQNMPPSPAVHSETVNPRSLDLRAAPRVVVMYAHPLDGELTYFRIRCTLIRKVTEYPRLIPVPIPHDTSFSNTRPISAIIHNLLGAPSASFLLPFGAKGSGLAMMIDIMTGVMTGALFGDQIPRMYDDDEPQQLGHLFYHCLLLFSALVSLMNLH